MDADERDRVRATLAVLPDRQATALLLRHAGHSYREIAAALGVAEGSVGVLLARGEHGWWASPGGAATGWPATRRACSSGSGWPPRSSVAPRS